MACEKTNLVNLIKSSEFPTNMVNCFKENTDTAVNNFKLYQKHKQLELIQNKYHNDYDKNINELLNENTTSKREIEINYNFIKRKEEKIKIFKYSFIAIAIFSIIPLLSISKIGLIPKVLAFLIWLIVMVVILIIVIFKLFIENRHRDDINFFEYNFEKPSNNEIARSKMQHELSKKDQDKCNALAELGDYIDPKNFSFDKDQMKQWGLNDDSENNASTKKCT
tara:strand:- start:36 stop:704 length:669 start_codon:yes stop_codon:yes gene_type:complete